MYLQVHRAVYDDIEEKSLYEMLWSTRYFGCLVWHLLSSDNITGLFKHIITMKRYKEHCLMFYVICPILAIPMLKMLDYRMLLDW